MRDGAAVRLEFSRLHHVAAPAFRRRAAHPCFRLGRDGTKRVGEAPHGFIGASIGTLQLSFKNLDEGLFNRTFALLAVVLAACVAAKSSSEFCMRSVGLMKRTHLNARLQAM